MVLLGVVLRVSKVSKDEVQESQIGPGGKLGDGGEAGGLTVDI